MTGFEGELGVETRIALKAKLTHKLTHVLTPSHECELASANS